MHKKSIRLQTCLKTFTEDQDKALKPEETLSHFYAQLKKLDTSILSEVKRIDNGRLGIPVYFSVCSDAAQGQTGTKKQMGKGASPIQAQASACMELAERFSFFSFIHDDSNFITGDYASLSRAGYPLLDIKCLLKAVHDENMSEDLLKNLLEDIPLRWTWATHLATEEDILVPFSWFYAINEFNGSSAGNTQEEAIFQGICEIVERHVCSLIARNRIATPLIDQQSLSDPVAERLIKAFRENGIDLYLNDFSLDTGICTIGALAIDPSTFPEKSEIVFTAGTASDPQKAVIRAVTEIAQLAGDFNTGANYVASGLPKPLSMEEVDYVCKSSLSTRVDALPSLVHIDICQEIKNTLSALNSRDFHVFLIDVRHPQLSIPAMYTIIPGAHFRERSMVGDAGLFAAKLLLDLVEDQDLLENKLQQMEELLPQAYYLQFYRGRLCAEQGRFQEAVDFFDKALERSPDKEDIPYIYSHKGSCLKDLGMYDQAIPILQAGLQADEERPDIHNLLGVCYFKKSEYARAISCFERAVVLNPASAIDYANLGVNYSRLGKDKEAVDYFTLALTLDPSLDFARSGLAEASRKVAHPS